MGVDILNYSGIVVTIEDMLGFVTEKNCEKIIKVCRDFYKNLVESMTPEEAEKSWNKQKIEFFKPLEAAATDNLHNLHQVLSELAVVEGEGMDMHVKFSEDLQSLWENIIATFKGEFPELTSVDAWGSCRYNGYDVPLNVACFVFDDDDCYEKKLSKAGKNLKKFVGHCNVSDWTVYSC